MSHTHTDDWATERWAPHDWAVVLAGGQGRRIAHLTLNDAGISVPKQFCSLGHGSSLVHEALLRARAAAPLERTLLTVTQAHRAWWRDLRDLLSPENLLVQPEQRCTGVGILHSLLEIMRRDPDASLAVLPADHYFRDEGVIASGLRAAMALTRKFPQQILLLAFEPEDFDPDLGYIVPTAAQRENLCEVSRFVEKPGLDDVLTLVDQGALCNSFMVAASGRALLDLFERHYPAVVTQLRNFVATPLEPAARREALARLFRDIPSIDFSKEIIASQISHLRVLRLPACGWSDLGTPARLDRVLRRHGTAIDQAPVAPASLRGHLDLAERSRAAAASGPAKLPRHAQSPAGDPRARRRHAAGLV
jgi:mannose-1-phosphate guanylyltransferase